MESLIAQLETRVSAARRAVETARESLAQAQDALKVWEQALGLALKQAPNERPVTLSASLNGSSHHAALRSISLEDTRNKETLVIAALKSAGEPMSASDLKRALGTTISRSMAFKLVRDLKNKGTVNTLPDGRIELIKEEQTKEATEAAS